MKPLFSDAKVVAPHDDTPRVNPVPEAFDMLKPLDEASANAMLPTVAAAPVAQSVRVNAPRINDEQIDALGSRAATGLAGISSQILGSVKASETGEFGKDLNGLVVLAKGLDPAALKDKGVAGRIKGIFGNAKEQLIGQFASVERQIDALTLVLDAKAAHHQKRIGDLDLMFTATEGYHQQLVNDISDATKLLGQLQADKEAAQAVAAKDSFGAQRLADHQRIVDRLTKKIDDLERARLLAQQAAPQIRLMQENARALVQKFGNVKTVTLPAWKNNFSLYVLQQEQKESVNVLNAVDDMTDEALRKNADLLRQNTEAIARSRQRAVVSVETLEHVQTQLLGSIDDVKRIEAEGKAQRAAERPKLEAMERALIAAFSPSAAR